MSDKEMHVLAFAALGCAAGVLLRRPLLGLAALAGFGALIEVGQTMINLGREGDLRDAAANLVGLAIALPVIAMVRLALRSPVVMSLQAARP